MLKEIFGFEKRQQKANNCLGHKLTQTENKINGAIDKTAGVANARIKIDQLHWYVPHYAPSIQQQGILPKQILSRKTTELRYIQRSVFLKQVNNRNLWNFNLGGQESINVPIWIILGFQQRERLDSQNLKKDTPCRLPDIGAQCYFGTENYPDAGVLLK